MAQFRLSVAIASRSAGRSVVAMAAYRAGCRLHEERSGRVHDYTRRRGVAYAGIVLPDNAPAWASDREQLWNRVEERERRSDAQLGREVQLSLPHELAETQRRELALAFARHMATEYGFAVDMAIHAPSEQGDSRNHHAHLLVTSRAFDAGHKSGWAKTKDRRLDAIAMRRAGTRNGVEDLREVWQAMQNAALASADVRDGGGDQVQVDRRSYARRGLDVRAALHDGPEETAFKRRLDRDRAAVRENSSAIRKTPGGRRGFRRDGLFSRTRPTAEAIRVFNQELGAPVPSAKTISRAEELRSAELLNTDPLNPDPLNPDPLNPDPRHTNPPSNTNPPCREDALQRGPRSLRPWRGRELDALNQELAETAKEEREKERKGGGGRQFADTYQRLDTDPRPKGLVPSILPELDHRGYGRSR